MVKDNPTTLRRLAQYLEADGSNGPWSVIDDAIMKIFHDNQSPWKRRKAYRPTKHDLFTPNLTNSFLSFGS